MQDISDEQGSLNKGIFTSASTAGRITAYLKKTGDLIEPKRSRAAAKTSSEFIETLQRKMPFKIKAIQVDGGSEFCSDFEYACKEKGVNLFVLPPRSPKLNGCVERSNRTHTEEFYEVNDCSWTVAELNEQLKRWEYIYT